MTNWLRKIFARTPIDAQQTTAPVSPLPAIDADAALRQGDAHVEAGRLKEAETSYRLALAKDPSSVAARVNLAFVLVKSDHAEQAVPWLVDAVALAPDNADAHFMLGAEYLRQRQLAPARNHLERAVEIQPSLVWAYPPLCQAAFELGDTAQALSVATRGLQVAPDVAELHHYLGNVHLAQGDLERAVAAYGEALRLQPRYAAVRANLGRVLVGQGRLIEAQASLRQALSDGPQDFASWCHLGDGFRDLGMLDEALAAYRQAARLQPDSGSVLASVGAIEQRMGKHDASAKAFERVVALEPRSALAYCNLASAYLALRRADDAMGCFERALAIDPDFAQAYALRAVLDIERGEFDRALPAFERAIALDSQNLEVRSNYLFSLNYVGDLPRYLAAAREFGAMASSRAKPFREWPVSVDAKDRPRPLRVGLVSGDLRSHPVGYFIESVVSQLAQHDIELFGFSTSPHADELTTRLKERLAGWQPIVGMTDDGAAHLIRDSTVHVLIDLSGHTAHNRLALFAWRPAPVQASWLGYFASTGVSEIDFLIADDVVVSDDSPDQFTERVWRLPHTRLCFNEPGARNAFPVSPLPAAERGHLTLGCYQNFNKINGGVLDAWGEVFRAIPDARLCLQSRQSGDPDSNAAMHRRLHAVGIDRSRVEVSPPSDRGDYLKSYANIDFALDTFPFPGGTTTCEALWMGVPTLTLRGQTMLQRQGAGLMTCAGLSQWVAADAADYVGRAVALAAAPAQLAQLRRSLRDQVLASPIFDAATFARHLADAMFGIWASGRPGGTGTQRRLQATPDPSA